jgi:predicted ATPase
LDMRRPSGEAPSGPDEAKAPAFVKEHNLRYRVEVEMLPKKGILRVTDEYLAALNEAGEPTRKRKPFIERQGDKLHLRLEGQAHPTYFDLRLDHTILSMSHYAPHYPHVVAAKREIASWLFFYFEPRERMRSSNPVKEVRHIGLMGEDLAAFLNTLKALNRAQFGSIERSLRTMMPSIEGIEVEVSDLGEVELRLKENGVAIPARVLSEGTLRLLGLLALDGAEERPSLVGFEEPENGIHPRRIELVSRLLKARAAQGHSQYVVTTHSPTLSDLLPEAALMVVRRSGRLTTIEPLKHWGPLGHRTAVDTALNDAEADELYVSERILRGDFDA